VLASVAVLRLNLRWACAYGVLMTREHRGIWALLVAPLKGRTANLVIRNQGSERESERRVELYLDMRTAIDEAITREPDLDVVAGRHRQVRRLLTQFGPRQLIGLRAHLGVEPPFPTHLSDHPDPTVRRCANSPR